MAKIPTILEPGRADGKLVTSDSIFDKNKNTFQSELNDIQDTLNSNNPNKPLSANLLNLPSVYREAAGPSPAILPWFPWKSISG